MRRSDSRWDQSAPAETFWICLQLAHYTSHNSHTYYRWQLRTLGRSKPVPLPLTRLLEPAGSADTCTSVSAHCRLCRRSRWSSPFAGAMRLRGHDRPFGATHEHRPWVGSQGGGGSVGGWPLPRRPPFSAQKKMSSRLQDDMDRNQPTSTSHNINSAHGRRRYGMPRYLPANITRNPNIT